MVICLLRGANDLQMVQLMPLPPPSSFASLKSRLFYFFWCRLTQVVLENGRKMGVLCGASAVSDCSTKTSVT